MAFTRVMETLETGSSLAACGVRPTQRTIRARDESQEIGGSPAPAKSCGRAVNFAFSYFRCTSNRDSQTKRNLTQLAWGYLVVW